MSVRPVTRFPGDWSRRVAIGMRGAEAVAKGVLHESPPQGTEVAMSIYSGIYNVGIGAGALVGGSVCDGMGLRFVGYVGGGIALIALVCCLTRVLPVLKKINSSKET